MLTYNSMSWTGPLHERVMPLPEAAKVLHTSADKLPDSGDVRFREGGYPAKRACTSFSATITLKPNRRPCVSGRGLYRHEHEMDMVLFRDSLAVWVKTTVRFIDGT
jgi:hypothetical protein